MGAGASPPQRDIIRPARGSEAAVKKIILGVSALLFLAAVASAVYSLLFGCPHGGSYHCVQGYNREVCGCPQS
jgi:hypothetical protein